MLDGHKRSIFAAKKKMKIRIIYLLLTVISMYFLVSCKKNNPNENINTYTTVEIIIENGKGEKIPGQYVKMFDEGTYALFKENHSTKALAESVTNKSGKAIFTLDNKTWFDGKSYIDLMFVVIEQLDKDNYRFSAEGGTIKKNDKASFTIIFQTKEDTPVTNLIIEDNILKGITNKNLTSIVLPANIKEIANNVFKRSNITEITLNDGIEKIGNECFLGSKIKKINFPSSLKFIDTSAFLDCSELEEIDMSRTQIEILSESIFLDSGLKNIILPQNLKIISSEAFCGTSKLENIEINKSIEEIGSMAFYKSGLTDITFHNNIKEIGYMAFADCINLTKIDTSSETGNNECFIDLGAFQNCTSLTEAKLPDNVNRLEGYTFIECKKLNKLFLPKNLKSIGEQGLRTNYNIDTIIFNSTQIPEFINENGAPTSNVLPFVNNINELLVPQESIKEYKNRFASYSNKIKGI